MGSNFSDYARAIHWAHGQLFPPESWNQQHPLPNNLNEDETKKYYYQIRFNALNFLLGNPMNPNADLFFLQEFHDFNDIRMNFFEKRGFKIILSNLENDPSKTDTAIAVRLDKFAIKEIHRFRIQSTEHDCLLVKVQEIVSGKLIGLSSIHLKGFDIEDYVRQKEVCVLNSTNSVALGDFECYQINQHINTFFHDCHFVVMGADMNAWPELFESEESDSNSFNRFRALQDKNTDCLRLRMPTSMTPFVKNSEYSLRELDYIFVRSVNESEPIEVMAPQLHPLGMIIDNAAIKNELLGLNPSDHVPVYASITHKVSPRFNSSAPNYVPSDQRMTRQYTYHPSGYVDYRQ